jgi:hypothetical protein
MIELSPSLASGSSNGFRGLALFRCKEKPGRRVLLGGPARLSTRNVLDRRGYYHPIKFPARGNSRY